MFGLFKKKDTSKTLEKGKTVEKQIEVKSNAKVVKTNKERKNSQKLIQDQRQQTEGQFFHRKKVVNSSLTKKEQKSNTIPTPKIQAKNNMKDIEERDTQRPQKMMTEPYGCQQQSKSLQQETPGRRQQCQYVQMEHKQKISLKSLKTTLQQLKNRVEYQNELIMTRELNNNKKLRDVHIELFYTKYFRFHQPNNLNDLAQRYGQILQSIQLLLSKLSNRIGKGVHFHKVQLRSQEKLQTIYIKDQSEFLLFFKHFFSKPYTLCNRPSTRKIIQVLWQSVTFKESNYDKLYEQLKLWVYGISVPSNPTLIMLHKVIFKNAEVIPKYAKMIYNDKIYMGINQIDPLLKTPLLLAVELQNKKAIQKLVKCGANPYLSPCFTKKGGYSFEHSQTKYKKNLFSLTFPQYSKKLLSPLQNLLFLKQDYNLLSDCMYFMELANIRTLKKQAGKIKQALKNIPDCTFQIDWKTYRGILSFKDLPSDIITIYKKDSMLRIDYNIDSIENPVKGKHFTILIKVKNQKEIQFYEIRHHNKTILNRMSEIDMNVIKERLNQFCTYPQARNSQIVQCKGMYEMKDDAEGKKIRMEMSLNMQTQLMNPQLKKNAEYKKPIFKNVSQYERSILQSELMDYKSFSTSQIQSVIQQTIVNQKLLPVKLKSKIDKSSASIQVQFQQQPLKLKHFMFIMPFFKTDSVFITKILKILSLIENQDVFSNLNLLNYLPTFSKISLDKDFTFQAQIKNLNYISISDDVFNVECRVVSDMNYEENLNNRALDSIQETVLMEDGYSINVSQFLGKSQMILQLEEQFARDKFEKMLEDSFIQSSRNSNILDELQDD